MGVSVQFVGINEVLKAFDNMECPAWSVCQGRALNFCSYGKDLDISRAELEEWLKMIDKRTTSAVYTLKFYEDHKGGRITAGTGETTSFNFRLFDEDIETGRRQYPARYVPGQDYNLMDEIRALKQEIKDIRDHEKTAIGGADGEPLEVWEKIIDHPIAIAVIGKVLNIDLSGMMAAGKIAGIPDGTDIDAIIDRLYKFDPDLNQHLYKLSVMAEKNPANFKMLLSMLDKM